MEQNIKKIKDKVVQNSVKDREWRERVKKRQKNEEWTSLSFRIAVKILRHLRVNKISQKSVAQQLNCSPQYLSKLLKGKENLTLETIWKLQKVLGIALIEVIEPKQNIENDLNSEIELEGEEIELTKEEVYLQARKPISINADYNYYIAV